MKYFFPLLFFCSLTVTGCKHQQPQFETILSVNDTVIQSGQLDTAIYVLKKRLILQGISDASVTANAKNKQITIHSAILDKEWIKNYLLKKGSLVFYECYSLPELSIVLQDADKLVATTIGKGKPGALINPLLDVFYEIARPYEARDGSQVVLGYIGLVTQENIPKLKKYLDIAREVMPYEAKILFRETQASRLKQKLYEVYVVKDNDRKFFANNHIVKSTAVSSGKYPSVHMGFDAYGIHVWTRLTTANVNKTIAIAIDDNVLSAPRVLRPITDGETEISGAFDKKEIQEVANMLRSGYLPLQLSFTSMQQLKSKE